MIHTLNLKHNAVPNIIPRDAGPSLPDVTANYREFPSRKSSGRSSKRSSVRPSTYDRSTDNSIHNLASSGLLPARLGYLAGALKETSRNDRANSQSPYYFNMYLFIESYVRSADSQSGPSSSCCHRMLLCLELRRLAAADAGPA